MAGLELVRDFTPVLIWPEMELVQGFMPDNVTCKFEEDPIKSEGAIVSTTFFPAVKGR